MSLFFTSDTHFRHKRIIEYSPNRQIFTDVREMEEVIIRDWNRVVEPNDTVYHLGDVAFCSPEETVSIISKLNGNIILVAGNHDGRLLRKRDIAAQCFKRVIFSYTELKIDNRFVVMSHYPLYSWNRRRYGAIHLHGHMHGMKGDGYPTGNILDVGIDTREDLMPYSWEEIKELFSGEMATSGDDHHE